MKNKAYILALLVIFVYLVIINPITSKEKEKEKDKKEKEKQDNSIKAENNVGGFDYSKIDSNALNNMSYTL